MADSDSDIGDENVPPLPKRDERSGPTRRRPRDDDRDYRDDDYDDERDDYADEPRRRRRPGRNRGTEATDFIVPTNVSGWSIVGCYVGLIAMCFFPLVIISLPASIIGLRNNKRRGDNYGSVTSDLRAIAGLIFSLIALCVGAYFLVMLASR